MFVYVIGLKEDLFPPYDNCYVGVSTNPSRRFGDHLGSRHTVGMFVRHFNLTYDENVILIFEGSKKECYNMENLLRPMPFMGLNEAVGGNGGYTSYTKERNEKISKYHMGKPKSEKHRENLSKYRIENKMSAGSKNNKARKWVLIEPDGTMHFIHGTFVQFCEERKLLPSALRYYRNKKVPAIKLDGYGGYRAKTEESLIMRTNTTDWSLFEAENFSVETM